MKDTIQTRLFFCKISRYIRDLEVWFFRSPFIARSRERGEFQEKVSKIKHEPTRTRMEAVLRSYGDKKKTKTELDAQLKKDIDILIILGKDNCQILAIQCQIL